MFALCLLLVSRPAPHGRARGPPKHAQSRRSAAGPRCPGDCRRRVRAPAVRRRRGIGLVRRGRDRVRIGAASNLFLARRSPRVLARRWRHVTFRAGGEQRRSRGRFQPEKVSHAAAGAGFWSGKGSCRIGSLRGVTGSRLVTCRILSASFRNAHGPRIPLDVTASQSQEKVDFWSVLPSRACARHGV